jgi:hypothetical protein
MRIQLKRMAGGAQKRDIDCAICGQRGRNMKVRYEVELPCKHAAELYVCTNCVGEEGKTRTGSLEIPDGDHFHVEGDKGRTWWDFQDVANWLTDWVRTPIPTESKPGHWEITVPPLTRVFYRCQGKREEQAD